MTQDQAFEVLKNEQVVFLTGSAGTGKTFLLNRFITHATKVEKQEVAVTASTGIAATHLQGRTIHSWSGMGIEKEMDADGIQKLMKKKPIRDRIKKTDVLVIDEISMIDAAQLDLVDTICRAVKDPFLPFGGIQTILCGDFFQLPPVNATNDSAFAFNSFIWNQSKIKVCYLTEQFRQDDSSFTNLLNKIRSNTADNEELELLGERMNSQVNHTERPTKLCTHNKDVDRINAHELSQIEGEEKTFGMLAFGPKELADVMKKSCLAPQELKLKVGAQVMFVKNNFDKGYANGTLGTVIEFTDDGYPVVEIATTQKQVIISPVSWEFEDRGSVVASIRQLPLRLAWAITVHKSQGMSLDVADINLSASFEHGMGYVALSRVRTLDGICLRGINTQALRVNPTIVEKDKEFKDLSQKLEL